MELCHQVSGKCMPIDRRRHTAARVDAVRATRDTASEAAAIRVAATSVIPPASTRLG